MSYAINDFSLYDVYINLKETEKKLKTSSGTFYIGHLAIKYRAEIYFLASALLSAFMTALRYILTVPEGYFCSYR